jgi:hypothetical protein
MSVTWVAERGSSSSGRSALHLPAGVALVRVGCNANLPHAAEDIIATAGPDWGRGPAHTALTGPAWWSRHQQELGRQLAQVAARACSPTTLTPITGAALAGPLDYGPASRRLQRRPPAFLATQGPRTAMALRATPECDLPRPDSAPIGRTD